MADSTKRLLSLRAGLPLKPNALVSPFNSIAGALVNKKAFAVDEHLRICGLGSHGSR
ncbi:hypothetical protein [Candidatus Nitrospira allomarina]|uniref:Uncharacterized protein n=1 Tax=Candidatus Nitrospira allomarina TaxID=3020900 RepID=A0AA96GA65_9BACT|nr:hypothetical protein [Candidatus Nitrospira allomarina]WNM58013.1 hypothetical protein PP769_18895 [Candidatus Nitrospira allomarina]